MFVALNNLKLQLFNLSVPLGKLRLQVSNLFVPFSLHMLDFYRIIGIVLCELKHIDCFGT